MNARRKKKQRLLKRHGRNARKLYNELTRICPGLGAALHDAFAGPLFPLIQSGVAISELAILLKKQAPYEHSNL